MKYSGIGWDHVGAHTLGRNRDSFGIAYIGDFTDELPNDDQIAAGFLLFKEGLRSGKLTPNYRIVGHRQVKVVASPGDAFYAVVKAWSRWKSAFD